MSCKSASARIALAEQVVAPVAGSPEWKAVGQDPGTAGRGESAVPVLDSGRIS
jgi:hypothetical protein